MLNKVISLGFNIAANIWSTQLNKIYNNGLVFFPPEM